MRQPELRQDTVEGRWVLISPGRAMRPMPHDEPFLTDEGACPFCEGNEQATPPEKVAWRLPHSRADGPGWRARIVPNRYPAVVQTAMPLSGPQVAAVGTHEVMVECPSHQASSVGLGAAHWHGLMRLARDRVARLSGDPAHGWVQLFKNAGGAAGASLLHAHMQILSVPVVPHRVEAMLERARDLGHCPVCRMVEWEKSQKTRMVAEENGLVAFCPFASGFPHEVWICPVGHQSHWETTPEATLQKMADLLWRVLARLEERLGLFPHNLVWQGAPRHHPLAGHGHWMVRVLPRLNGIAGFEWGTGMLINTVPPEEAAGMLAD